MTVAHNALVTIFGLHIAMLGKKVRHLCLNGMDEQRSRPVAQNLGERVADGPWLISLTMLSVCTAYHSFIGEVGA